MGRKLFGSGAPVVDSEILHRRLQDLPFKIELNRFAQIVMSPASNWYGALQLKISSKLLAFGGEVITQCYVQPFDSNNVADVAWLSDSFVGGTWNDYP